MFEWLLSRIFCRWCFQTFFEVSFDFIIAALMYCCITETLNLKPFQQTKSNHLISGIVMQWTLHCDYFKLQSVGLSRTCLSLSSLNPNDSLKISTIVSHETIIPLDQRHQLPVPTWTVHFCAMKYTYIFSNLILIACMCDPSPHPLNEKNRMPLGVLLWWWKSTSSAYFSSNEDTLAFVIWSFHTDIQWKHHLWNMIRFICIASCHCIRPMCMVSV